MSHRLRKPTSWLLHEAAPAARAARQRFLRERADVPHAMLDVGTLALKTPLCCAAPDDLSTTFIGPASLMRLFFEVLWLTV